MKMKKSESEFFIFTRSSLTPPIFLKFHYVPYTFLFALRIQYEKKFKHVLLSFIALSPKPLGQVCV